MIVKLEVMEGKSGSYKGTAGLHKRKAEDEINSDKEKSRKVGAPVSKPNDRVRTINKTTPSTSTMQNGSSATPKTETAPGAPKPGSYKAMLAKAAAIHEAQLAKNPTGGVRHKDHREQQRKRDEEAKIAARAKLKGKAPKKPVQRPATSVVKSGPVAKGPTAKGLIAKAKPPSPPQPTYKGTAGLGRPVHAQSVARKVKRPAGASPPRRRQVYSDEEEDEEEEYDSDASSVMEAGMDELDEEEEAALLAAKLEDKREEELERRLKVEKEARLKKRF